MGVLAAALCVVTVCSALMLTGCSPAEPMTTERNEVRVRVRTATAAPPKAASDIVTVGVVRFKREVLLAFKVGGIVKDISVEATDRVTRGQQLAQLDQTEFAARNHNSAAAYHNAERTLARRQKLYQRGFISRSTLDDAQMLVDQLRASQAISSFDVHQSTLRAPGDGVVLTRLADPGEVVAAGKPIILFADTTGGVVVIASVTDRQTSAIHVGDRATVAVSGRPLIEAVVDRAAASTATGLFDVELRLVSESADLISGMVGAVVITPSDGVGQAAYPSIPASGIEEARGDQAVVFVVEDGRIARRRSVRTAGFVDGSVLIAYGIRAGEEVVTSGAEYLRDGHPVLVESPSDAGRGRVR